MATMQAQSVVSVRAYLSSQSNLSCLIWPRSVQQADSDSLCSCCHFIAGLQSCYWNLQVKECLVAEHVISGSGLSVQIPQVGFDLFHSSHNFGLLSSVVHQFCLSLSVGNPGDACSLWDIVCRQAIGTYEGVEQGGLAYNTAVSSHIAVVCISSAQKVEMTSSCMSHVGMQCALPSRRSTAITVSHRSDRQSTNFRNEQ